MLHFAKGRQAGNGRSAGIAIGRPLGDPTIEPLRFLEVAGEAGKSAGEKLEIRVAGVDLERSGDVGPAAAEIALATGERRREIPGEGVGRDELKRMIDVPASAGDVVERNERPSPVEMDLAAKLACKSGRSQGLVE